MYGGCCRGIGVAVGSRPQWDGVYRGGGCRGDAGLSGLESVWVGVGWVLELRGWGLQGSGSVSSYHSCLHLMFPNLLFLSQRSEVFKCWEYVLSKSARMIILMYEKRLVGVKVLFVFDLSHTSISLLTG